MTAVHDLLNQYNIRPDPGQGQHFLTDESTLDFITDVAELDDTDTVLEIGAGIGNLTEKLVPHCSQVIAVERDPRLAAVLRDRFDEDAVTVVEDDILTIDFPHCDKCVSNLPYYISSEITEQLAENGVFSIVMYQKAFADRVCAAPGDKQYSRISVLTRFYYHPQMLLHVEPDMFTPPPQVESALVRLRPRDTLPDVDRDLFFQVTKTLFTHKRKKVRNAIVDSAYMLDVSRDVLKDTDIPHAHTRVTNLDISDLVDITEAVRPVV